MPHSGHARPDRAGGPLPLRVGFVGEQGLAWLGGCVDAVQVPGHLGGAETPDGLDALVVDPRPAGLTRTDARTLAREARRSGAAVIGLAAGSGGGGDPVWSGLESVAIGEGATDGQPMWGVEPVDLRAFNPTGYRHVEVAGLACVVTTPRADLEAASPLLAEAAAEEPLVAFLPRGAQAPSAPDPVVVSSWPKGGEQRLHTLLKERLGALDHPALHASEAERAAALVRLCASGVPVVAAGLSGSLRAMLGEELAGALAAAAVDDLLDLDRRERVSIAQRRAALRGHSLDARWRALCAALGIAVPPRPKVSVILSTRRQEWLSFGISQVVRQTYQPRELVVCLHGDDFSPDVEERLRAEVEGPLEVVRVASELTLGDALNQGVEIASGEFVTKMDDDDYYSVDHLWDLVLASEYSGADLVGKAAEFVYLEDIDVTIRQLSRDVETRLAGGGTMFRRTALKEVGGWPSLSRAEDLAIVRRFEEGGRRIHRTHAHGYILNRHGRDHTWRPYVDYFLFRSAQQWRGLRFDQAGIS